MQDTIFALSSGRPPAAVAVIRISGAKAHGAAAELAGSLPPARQSAVRQLHNPRSGELLDQALVLRFDAPKSATGEDLVELHCHGGRAVTDAVASALRAVAGLRLAEPGEFTRRAFDNGRIDLTEAEGLADLIEAETQSQRRAALALAEGGLRRQIEDWQQQLMTLSAAAELVIDYDEEDAPLDPVLPEGCAELASELEQWLQRPRAERLRDGVRVVIAGPPNAGKSSLINALVGEERAIVTEIAGTTRDHIEIPLSLGGVPVLLTDTAGLRESDDAVEAIGVERAQALVSAAEVLLWLGDEPPPDSDARVIRVHSKFDLPARVDAPAGSWPVSVVTGAGLPELMRAIEQAARALLPREDTISLNRRQADHIAEAAAALAGASNSPDVLLIAEGLRTARGAFDRLTGKAGVEDVLDALFGRFCLGK